MRNNYFQILGVSPSATDEEIRLAYYELIKKYHPDNHETGDTERCAEINRAYRVVSNAEKRESYRRYLAAPSTQTPLTEDCEIDVTPIIKSEEHYNRGRALMRARRYPEAIREYTAAIRLYGDDPAYWASLIYAQYLSVPATDALSVTAAKLLKNILDRNPNLTDGWRYLGYVCKRAGQTSFARVCFEQALAQDNYDNELRSELRHLDKR